MSEPKTPPPYQARTQPDVQGAPVMGILTGGSTVEVSWSINGYSFGKPKENQWRALKEQGQWSKLICEAAQCHDFNRYIHTHTHTYIYRYIYRERENGMTDR